MGIFASDNRIEALPKAQLKTFPVPPPPDDSSSTIPYKDFDASLADQARLALELRVIGWPAKLSAKELEIQVRAKVTKTLKDRGYKGSIWEFLDFLCQMAKSFEWQISAVHKTMQAVLLYCPHKG